MSYFGASRGVKQKDRFGINWTLEQRRWEAEQKRKGTYHCRTLEDMSEDEIRQLELQLGGPIKRPTVHRVRQDGLCFTASPAEIGPGWVGRCEEIPGIVRYGKTQEAAIAAIKGVVLPIQDGAFEGDNVANNDVEINAA